MCISANPPRPTRSESGISMVELAITFPAFLLIMASIVDAWTLYWRSDVMLTASTYGARAGAAQARKNEAIDNYADACNDDSGSSGVLSRAVYLTYQLLNAAKLEPGTCSFTGTPIRRCAGTVNYDITAKFDLLCEGAKGQRIVTVNVDTKAGATDCLLCFGGFLSWIKLKEQTSFAVEADCMATGDYTCS